MAEQLELRVMPAYGAHPLWTVDAAGSVDNVPAAQVVSAALATQLEAWAAECAPESGFGSPQRERDFVARGWMLARLVEAEVGGQFDAVRYFDVGQRAYLSLDG
jgi:anti-sigma factor RsiW